MEREQLKIAIYARVSTKKGQDPAIQLAELREYIRNRKWKINGEYVDKGIPGASDSRPELISWRVRASVMLRVLRVLTLQL
jgi:hypothetical protein